MMEPVRPSSSVVLVSVPFVSVVRRLLRWSVPILLGCGGLTVLAAPAPASAPAGSMAKVTRGICSSSSVDAKLRSASFTVRIRDAATASASYGFRAVLQEQQPDDRWRALQGSDAPSGLNTFQAAQAGFSSMKRKINVQGLRQGSRYRLRVSFRWATAKDVRSVVRTSRSCLVRDRRPNLEVTDAPGWIPSTTGGQVAYRVKIKTSRRSALPATGVVVVIRQGDQELGRGTFVPKSSKDTALIHGSRCVATQPVTIEVDPQRAIDERDERDNLLVVPCQPEGR